tara:strand:+ start:529 stop:810 length:282 start_codon:yes stop_codon:yes gene_type:complete
MSKEEITEIQKHFTCYSKNDYVGYLYEPQKVIGHYYHTEEDYFKIIIFEDDSVYQINSEHETQGIELEDYDKLAKRFESFTGTNIELNQNKDE